MRTFIFNGVSSDTYELIINKIDRPVLPELRENKITIPGKDGSWDFGGNKYNDAKVGIDVTLVDPLDKIALLRQIGVWLKVKGYLAFSDEPDKNYLGRVYSVIYPEHSYRISTFKLIFVCDPFTYTDVEAANNPITYDTGYYYDDGELYYNDTEFNWLYPKHMSGMYNKGLETTLKITITGTVQGIKISHEEAEKVIELDLNLDSDILIIDSQTMTITKNGSNVLSSLSASSEFFGVLAGDNSLIFEGLLPDCDVEYDWVITEV